MGIEGFSPEQYPNPEENDEQLEDKQETESDIDWSGRMQSLRELEAAGQATADELEEKRRIQVLFDEEKGKIQGRLKPDFKARTIELMEKNTQSRS